LSQSPLIVKYEKALAQDPRSLAFAPLAEAYRKVGLIDKSFEVLKKGIRYNPDYIMGYLSLSQCYFEKEEYSLAYTTLRPIAAKNRDNFKLQKLYGEVCYKTQNYEEALDTFKYLLFLNPKDREVSQKVFELEARLSESSIISPQNEVTFTIDDLSPSPENDRALDDWIQVDLSRQSVEDSDSEEGSQEGLGVLPSNEWEEGRPKLEAKEELGSEELSEVELDLDEDNAPDDTPVITHTLVDLYINQGHTQKAIEILEKIIQIQPDNHESIERLKLLRGDRTPEAVDNNEDLSQAPRQDEGHSNLSAVLDETLKDEYEGSEKVDEVLSDFLALLRSKSDEYSLKPIRS
jgi:tetratricopeptide (TPR) repeat protein